MRILDIAQRSQEWLDFHDGKISGSRAKEFGTPRTILKAEWLDLTKRLNIPIPLNKKGEPQNLTIQELKNLIGAEQVEKKECEVSLGDAIYKLIAERIAKPINPNDYADRLNGRTFSMMVRGEILEAEALTKIATKLNKQIIAGRLWQSELDDNIICSPDGEIESPDGAVREAVEIKCLSSWQVVRAFYKKQPPTEYIDQIVQYFVVNEQLETLYFAIYSDAFALAPQMELQIFEIRRQNLEDQIRRATYYQTSALALVEQEVTKLLF